MREAAEVFSGRRRMPSGLQGSKPHAQTGPACAGQGSTVKDSGTARREAEVSVAESRLLPLGAHVGNVFVSLVARDAVEQSREEAVKGVEKLFDRIVQQVGEE